MALSAASAKEFGERVEGLYRQAAANGWAAMVASACLVAVMWRFVPPLTLLGWFALSLLAIAARIPLVRAFAADRTREQRAAIWARRYTWMVFAGGACWGLGAVLMLREDDPLAVASFLIILAPLSAGSIASQSFYLPPVVGFVSLALVPAILRLASWGNWHYAPEVATLSLFLLFLLANARTQNQRIREATRLRQSNLDLIEALKLEKQESDLLRTRAEQANLAKSQFLAAASHDLRQPLHALGLFSSALQETAIGPEQRAVVEKVFASIDALESLFNELLDLSRLDAGQIKPKIGPVALAPLFARLNAQYAPLAQERGLELRITANDLAVRSDAGLLERVLTNLVANAIRYTPRGSVQLLAQPDEDAVIVSVEDTGVGIPEALQERVFEEFFQVGNPERDRRKGLGLGLAIVRRIAAMLDHPLALHSEVGQGSAFALRVPAAPLEAVPTESDSIDPPGDILLGKTVLVIDDEAAVLDGMQTLLQAWGCEMLRAQDTQEALAQVRQRVPDAIVADLRLRDGASGVDAIHALQTALRRAVPALVVTGDTSVEALKHASAQGFPVLHKPVRRVKLRAVLSQLLSGEPARRS